MPAIPASTKTSLAHRRCLHAKQHLPQPAYGHVRHHGQLGSSRASRPAVTGYR